LVRGSTEMGRAHARDHASSSKEARLIAQQVRGWRVGRIRQMDGGRSGTRHNRLGFSPLFFRSFLLREEQGRHSRGRKRTARADLGHESVPRLGRRPKSIPVVRRRITQRQG
jgi:hypothetical protein